MQTLQPDVIELPAATRTFYRDALTTLSESSVPFLICGSYALESYTQVGRPTRDLDILVCKEDCGSALAVLSAAGYSAEIVFPHWLAKAYCGEDCLDVIFNSGNGLCPVDATWFAYARPTDLFGVAVRVCPPEEAIWQQAFIMERERYDGADVAHLLRAQAAHLDWDRLLLRFGPHWRVLLAHLILFGFTYPAEQSRIPDSVIHQLLTRLRGEMSAPPSEEPLCRGTLLSRAQYLADVERWGYIDARLFAPGGMSREEIDLWTAPIAEEAAKLRRW